MGGRDGIGGYVNVSFNGTTYDVTPDPVSPESQFIQSGQGFIVHAAGGSGTTRIVIRESDKSTTAATNVFRPSGNVQGVRISLKSVDASEENVLDQVYASYSSDFSNAVDDMDVLKLDNFKENLSISTTDKKLMVERRALIKLADTVQLNLSNLSNQVYVLAFNPQNLGSLKSAVLEDLYLHTATALSLSEVTRLNFQPGKEGSKNTNRFRLILASKNIAETPITKHTIKAFPNPLSGNTVNVDFADMPTGNYNVEISNSLGVVVFRSRIVYDEGASIKNIRLQNKLVKGAYQLKVSQKEITSSIKIISN